MQTPSGGSRGFEAISPIDSAFRPYLASPITRTPSSYGFQQPNTQFFMTEDTESNMVCPYPYQIYTLSHTYQIGAQATIEKQQKELKEAAEIVEVLRDSLKEKDATISASGISSLLSLFAFLLFSLFAFLCLFSIISRLLTEVVKIMKSRV